MPSNLLWVGGGVPSALFPSIGTANEMATWLAAHVVLGDRFMFFPPASASSIPVHHLNAHGFVHTGSILFSFDMLISYAIWSARTTCHRLRQPVRQRLTGLEDS